jgi:plastocyanin
LVEHQLPKLRVVGSSPIARFVTRNVIASIVLVSAFALASTPALAGKPKPATKVTVLEFEFGFKLSRTTVPAGRVAFVMGNSGAIVHNFDIVGVKVGPFLVPGQRSIMTIALKKGEYTYVCSVKYHASQGMQGTLIVD